MKLPAVRQTVRKRMKIFIHLRVTYTWKEIQARTGYILHGLHRDDVPVEMVTTGILGGGSGQQPPGRQQRRN